MNERERERRRRQQQSIENLSGNGLPVTAEERLQQLQGAHRPLFTSDLAPSELLMLRKAGCRPIAQVTGANVYNISWQTTPKRGGGRLGHLSTIHWLGQMLAVARMQEEARRLKAYCVVGTRIQKLEQLGDDLTYGYEALGTAVEFSGEAPPQQPYVCTLTAGELWALREAGFQSVGFVLGNCVWYQIANFSTMMANRDITPWGFDTSRQNQELADYSQGLCSARMDAMERLFEECKKAGASGVLNTQVRTEFVVCPVETRTKLRRTDLIISAAISGTAVTERASGQLPPIDYAQVMTG
jgi:uncharacterized protein YbjQ (UPF0145 family)